MSCDQKTVSQITPNDLIERWVNVARVLDTMPEHERQKHWDMATWGERNDCGTIACAAGHCGMDPWFRDKGFTLDFDEEGDMHITNVESFFGFEGSSRIFLDHNQRPVETVLGEVREFIEELRKVAEFNARAPVAVGEVWAEKGGVFAGACLSALGRDGEPEYFLILGPESERPLAWSDANAWAASLDIEGHRDFVLPTREEQRALLDRVKPLFQPDYYWSSEQHASYSDYAWGQYFSYGYQNGWDKYDELRARAVRRLPI
jgi:hypothetical protein